MRKIGNPPWRSAAYKRWRATLKIAIARSAPERVLAHSSLHTTLKIAIARPAPERVLAYSSLRTVRGTPAVACDLVTGREEVTWWILASDA